MNNLCMLFIIINYTDEKRINKIIEKYKIGFKVIMHGKGTASSSLLEYFGLNEEEKSIMTMVLPKTNSKHILKEIQQQIKVHEHGRGIAFTIPLSSGSKYMIDYYQKYEMEDIEMNEFENHLIITIVNEGYAEKVMNEAKKAGATGGTSLTGRGLEYEKAVKFLNISIEPEKDVVLILASSEHKNNIMNTIVENCGLKTKGAGICFSLPVDNVIGLKEEILN